MHIPDGFLSLQVSAATAALSLGGFALAIKRAQKKLKERLIPIMGVLSAFVFAAQMFNFPVAAGTSGHLLGGMLTAVIVGPWAATIVISCVLIIQSLLFQDGGLIALGANIFNMAIAGTWSGWLLYLFVRKIFPWRAGFYVGVFIGAWFSVVVAAAVTAAELGLSGTATLSVVFMAMVGVHAVIGIGEGIITLLVVMFLKKVKPELIS